ncbi:cytochrome c oxidase subunit 8B, mitochondrial [Polyodon spathula]|uniref:cytochrome c oxidase subunit 8B, mitochondrial n=1 Tax=Polyodon spathula TaxID=7913 RepID=UPI001B7DC799|nr:cytochrome c oxidase subunit 8B, mitochondrial [Polyodon spathula]
MPVLSRTFRLLNASVRQQIIPKASITAKPAKDVITPAQQAFAMGTMFVTILLPAGWILSHLEDYKRRP